MIKFLHTLTSRKVSAFSSDSTKNLQEFGIQKPLISISLLFFSKPSVNIYIGEKDGKYYAHREGVESLYEVDALFLESIPIRSWDWQSKEIWNVSVADIVSLKVNYGETKELSLKYDYLDDLFTGADNQKDHFVNQQKAKTLLNLNHKVRSFKKLSNFDMEARTALDNPVLRLILGVQEIKEDGSLGAVIPYSLIAAPMVKAERNRFSYVKTNRDKNYFMIDEATMNKMIPKGVYEKD